MYNVGLKYIVYSNENNKYTKIKVKNLITNQISKGNIHNFHTS